MKVYYRPERWPPEYWQPNRNILGRSGDLSLQKPKRDTDMQILTYGAPAGSPTTQWNLPAGKSFRFTGRPVSSLAASLINTSMIWLRMARLFRKASNRDQTKLTKRTRNSKETKCGQDNRTSTTLQYPQRDKRGVHAKRTSSYIKRENYRMKKSSQKQKTRLQWNMSDMGGKTKSKKYFRK